MVRELFEMARSKKACIIFFDEVDAIGGARFDDGAGGDNEVQRTMLELINQLDGFDPRGNIKVLMATNRSASSSSPALPVTNDEFTDLTRWIRRYCGPDDWTAEWSSLCLTSKEGHISCGSMLEGSGRHTSAGRSNANYSCSCSMSVERDIRFDLIARLCPNTTGAELRSVATEVWKEFVG